MKNTQVGGTRKKAANMVSMAGLVLIFLAYMFPFIMVVINSLKQKRDIIKSPFSWLYTIKGLSFDNFVKAFTNKINASACPTPNCLDVNAFSYTCIYTIKGLSFDNFVKAFTQMDFLNAFKNSLIVTVSATVLVTLLAAMLAYYIVQARS